MSFIAPSLPENAPFSPPQRAWLNGFLAGFLGDGAAANSLPGQVDTPSAGPAPPPAEPEDFPWHDPGLPLDDRIALAAGRRPERSWSSLSALGGGEGWGEVGHSSALANTHLTLPIAAQWVPSLSALKGGEGINLRRLFQEAAQHVLQDAAVAEVFDLVERVDAADQLLLARAPADIVNPQGQLHARLQPGLNADDV